MVAAYGTAMLFSGVRNKGFVPLVFIAVLILLAYRYGLLVSVIGSAMSALIFARFLYAPVGDFGIENAAAKTNLGWMILGAVCVSYLLLPPSNISNHKH